MAEENPEHVGNQAVSNAVADGVQNAILQGIQTYNSHMAALSQLTLSVLTASHDKLLGISDTTAERQQDLKGAQSSNPTTGGQPEAGADTKTGT